MDSLTQTIGMQHEAWSQYYAIGQSLGRQQSSCVTGIDQLQPEYNLLVWIYECIEVGAIRTRQQLKYLLEMALIDMDKALSLQINQILHHQNFKQLESSWHGLQYLIDTQSEFNNDLTVKIKVLNISWREVAKDLSKAIEFDQSLLFQRIYGDEFDTPGGEPFGVMVGDYYISHRFQRGEVTNDIDTLREIGNICTAALCPFITGSDPSLFGVNSFSELTDLIDLEQLFSQQEYRRWKQLRNHESSRFIGITIPQIIMRKPYKDDDSRYEQHRFKESTANNADTEYVWGNASFAFGGVLIRAFANTGWFADIRGGVHEFGEGGVVKNLNYTNMETDASAIASRPATNIQIDDRLETELSQQGFIPLCSYHSDNHSVFYSNSSLHSPEKYTTEIATANARMSSMIQYMLCVSRFGHYLKVIGRDRIGSVASAQDCQRVFQNWLNQYTTSSDGVSSTIKARYPLSESRVEIKEQAGKLGCFTCTVHLKPHFQLEQLVSSIQLVTELSLGRVGAEI